MAAAVALWMRRATPSWSARTRAPGWGWREASRLLLPSPPPSCTTRRPHSHDINAIIISIAASRASSRASVDVRRPLDMLDADAIAGGEIADDEMLRRPGSATAPPPPPPRTSPYGEARPQWGTHLGGLGKAAAGRMVGRTPPPGEALAISFSTMRLFTGITPLNGSNLQYAGLAALVWRWVVVSFTWFIRIAIVDICSFNPSRKLEDITRKSKHIMFVFRIMERRRENWLIEFVDVF